MGNAGRVVTLIGFQDQGNLAVGYLASTLTDAGYVVQPLDFRAGDEAILEAVRASQPVIVGFSLIFQYYLPGYERLARFLRDGGVEAHFTIGGHYPSLCPRQTLEAISSLDSVVRFEGEATLLELAGRLSEGRAWTDVAGIAYRDDGEMRETEPRALAHDLDELPLPHRYSEPEQILGRNALPVLASRGCVRTCSFCSIHTFYRTAPGKVVRKREPERVVREMRRLREEFDVTIFLFQDDDFPIWGKVGRRWVDGIVEQLYRQDLVGEVIWKISCRADYVEPELFSQLRDAGLYLVYMGLESGSESGLQVLDKKITVETNLQAVAILKDLGLMFEYGFMLFDPSSTFESIRRNVGFLRAISGDGSAAATFCRMLPYGGTPIRDSLAEEGRLKGDVTRPDYDFLDPRLDAYHPLLDRAAAGWIHGKGISHQLNWAWHEVGVIERLSPEVVGLDEYKLDLRELTRDSNDRLFTLVEESSLAFENGDSDFFSGDRAGSSCREIAARLIPLRDEFVARNQALLLSAVATPRPSGPIVSPQIF